MKKSFVNLVLVGVVIALVVIFGYFALVRKNTQNEIYTTYKECVEKTQLPCKHYYIGDLGQGWSPSPFLTKEECEKSGIRVGSSCVIPSGNFKENRWIESLDLQIVDKDWKNYSSSDYGFELQYPPIYTAKSYTDTKVPGELFTEVFTGPEKGQYSGPPSYIGVHVWDNSKKLSLVDWAKANSSFSNYASNDVYLKHKDEIISGHKAISYSWQGEGYGKTVVVENNETIVLLDTLYDNENDKVLQDFDSIISTLKFKDSTNTSTKTGVLSGKVLVGPTCPVERVDQPCKASPEANMARQVGVFEDQYNLGMVLVSIVHLDANGNYSFNLLSGNYEIRASGMQVDKLTTIVGKVVIKAGQTTTLNFSIDTGIR